MQAPTASAAAGTPMTNPSDPNYADGAPTANPAPPPRSKAGHSYVGDWQTSCLGVCCYDPAICIYAQASDYPAHPPVSKQRSAGLVNHVARLLTRGTLFIFPFPVPRRAVLFSCLPCLLVSQRIELMRTHSPPLTEYTCCMSRLGGQSERTDAQHAARHCHSTVNSSLCCYCIQLCSTLTLSLFVAATAVGACVCVMRVLQVGHRPLPVLRLRVSRTVLQ